MKAFRHQSTRSGYTLIEMLVASISAIFLVVGLGSAIFIAAKATDDSNSPSEATLQGHAAMTDLVMDIQLAFSFSETTATAVTFTVPDRNGDATPETIRYAWSGTPGDPLTRQYNGGTIATVVDNVHDFQVELPLQAPNLLTNPGIESGTANWEAMTGATMYAASTPVYAGAKSLYAYRNSASSESGVRQNVTAQIVNGTPYKLGAWMRKWAAPKPFDVRVQLHIISTGGGDQVFPGNAFNIDMVGYKWVSATVTPTWSGTLTAAYWEATGISNIQGIYVDNAEMRPAQSACQNINLKIQVGSDSRSRLDSGVKLWNDPF